MKSRSVGVIFRAGQNMKKLVMLVAVAMIVAPASRAQKKKLSVQIVNRQSSATEYTYTVPGYATSNCNAFVYGNTASGTVSLPPHPRVRGVTPCMVLRCPCSCQMAGSS